MWMVGWMVGGLDWGSWWDSVSLQLVLPGCLTHRLCVAIRLPLTPIPRLATASHRSDRTHTRAAVLRNARSALYVRPPAARPPPFPPQDTNQLTGPLPAEWACLDNLIEIDFSKNRLSGTIPPEWGVLERCVQGRVRWT